jgi:hypothetical protein
VGIFVLMGAFCITVGVLHITVGVFMLMGAFYITVGVLHITVDVFMLMGAFYITVVNKLHNFNLDSTRFQDRLL